jgi:hypothetical protein
VCVREKGRLESGHVRARVCVCVKGPASRKDQSLIDGGLPPKLVSNILGPLLQFVAPV